MSRISALVVAVIAANPAIVCAQESTSSAPVRTFDPSGSDPAAVALVDRVWKLLGGRSAYEAINYVQFTASRLEGSESLSSHTILWDRREDRVRLQMQTRRGELLVFLRMRDGAGTAFENGEVVPEEDRSGVVNHARALCEDDLYWLLMPWRLKDPGVHLHSAGEVERDGARLKRVRVTMDPGGWLGPGQLFHIAVDPRDGRLVEWSWPRTEADGGSDEVIFTWADWVQRSGVQFASVRQQVGGTLRVLCRPIETPEAIEPEACRKA